ncbi:MAG: protein kinase [Reyranellaceae bacterium]
MTDDKTRIAADADEHFVALHSGFVLGKYELQAVLGQGGFGITYKAWDGALNRAVAIKEYLPSDVAVRVDGTTVRAKSRHDEEGFQWGLERFLDEARALARFEASHSIVRVYDYMQANGTAYMIMALIDGTPLSSVYKREAPLSEERLKAIMLPILDGLQDVHEAGFLHRDIKPANILLRANGQPVLIDFGAARQALGEKSRSITSVFTPGYAPFEQYTSSGKQGPWTDIYALAATLYHGIAGKAPPQATDRIREDPMEPAVRLGAGRYSPQFLAAIDRGLEVFENRRPQNVAHWRDMLSGGIALAVPPQSPQGAAPMPVAGHEAPRTQPSQPPTAVPTLNEYGAPSQGGPASQGAPQTQRGGGRRIGLIAAAVALVLAGGGAAAFFALSGGDSKPMVAADETPQQRAQRLGEEARVAAEQARKAQDAVEAETRRQAEQEARQEAQEEERRRADTELARQAEQTRRDAEKAQRENDADAKRRAEEEASRLAAAEAQRKAETEKLEQERKALEAARAKAEVELAEARRQAEEARQQADALRAQAEKARQEEQRRQEAEAKTRAEQEARAKAEAETKRKVEAEARAKADAEAKAKAEAEARARTEAEARRKAEADAKAKAEQEARQRTQAAAVPAPAAPSPPPPVTSADIRNAAGTTQQAAVAPATPGFAYAGTYRLVIDCPDIPVSPFVDHSVQIAGPQFSASFYRDGKGDGTIAGNSLSYRMSFTGRGGNSFSGSFSLNAGPNGFRGGGAVNGFVQGRPERPCTVTMRRL